MYFEVISTLLREAERTFIGPLEWFSMSIMMNENILSSPQVMWDEGELILLDYWTRSKTETCIDITAGNRRLTKKIAHREG